MGFYLTPELECAKRMALRKSFNSGMPAIVELKLRKHPERFICIKDFGSISLNSADTEILNWAQFIINNRCGWEYIQLVVDKNGFGDHNLDKKYDLVIGTTADGSVTKTARKCKSEKRMVSLKEAKEFLDKSFGKQYCISTEKGLSVIEGSPRNRKGVSWR